MSLRLRSSLEQHSVIISDAGACWDPGGSVSGRFGYSQWSAQCSAGCQVPVVATYYSVCLPHCHWQLPGY
eukprot:3617952-Rhodomonas_salina.4